MAAESYCNVALKKFKYKTKTKLTQTHDAMLVEGEQALADSASTIFSSIFALTLKWFFHFKTH